MDNPSGGNHHSHPQPGQLPPHGHAHHAHQPLEELVPLLRLAWPVSLSLLGGLLMQVVDTMFVGRLSAAAIGGVSVGNAMFATFMIIGIGLLTGLDYFASHAFGGGHIRQVHQYLVQALYLGGVSSVLLIGCMQLGSLAMPYLHLDPEVARLGQHYLHALCWSLIPFLLFTAIRQYLQAMGIVMPALVILIVANGVNAACDWVFVFGNLGVHSMGVFGAGMATLVSRTFMFAAIAAYTLLRDRRLALGLRQVSLKLEVARLAEIVRLGLPSALQMLFEVGVFAGATMLVGRLGAVPLAAHQVVLQMASLTFMIPLGLASATCVRVGQALGAGHPARARHVGWAAILIGAAFSTLMGTGMFVFAEPLLHAFTRDNAVVHAAIALLLVAALFQLSDGAQVIGAGALRGLGNSKISMYSNLVGHWLLGLPVGYTLCFHAGMGARGIWIGLSVGLTSVALALVFAWWQKSHRMHDTVALA